MEGEFWPSGHEWRSRMLLGEVKLQSLAFEYMGWTAFV